MPMQLDDLENCRGVLRICEDGRTIVISNSDRSRTCPGMYQGACVNTVRAVDVMV